MPPQRPKPLDRWLPPILRIQHLRSLSGYSKGSWGLSVLPRDCGIFTATPISPSLPLRHWTSDYAIHARQNLPDKEFRYLRTVIVTAAVHRGFSSNREALPLTFRHWAGVSPYTSTFVLAETYVFGKQLHGFFSCDLPKEVGLIPKLRPLICRVP